MLKAKGYTNCDIINKFEPGDFFRKIIKPFELKGLYYFKILLKDSFVI